jgi:hypothetical protein
VPFRSGKTNSKLQAWSGSGCLVGSMLLIYAILHPVERRLTYR